MEKTIQIIIAKTTFLCTEEAYDRLSVYLDQMKRHFVQAEENEEIMHDIESRIAEKLLEQKQSLITINEVRSVVTEIGEVSELEDDAPENVATAEKLPRRLYRDTDNALIGGVAAGIASYFNINTLFVRILFVVSIFFGGVGFLIYFLLWVFIPEARTTAQKLEMLGEPVTFEAIRGMVQTRAGESHGAFLGRIPLFIHALVTKVLKFAGKAFGVVTMLGSFIGLIALTTFLGIILTNWNTPFSDIPLREASSNFLLLTTVFAGYVAILIPLVFVFILGFRLLRVRTTLSSTVGFSLVGIWSLALIICGISGFKIGSDFYTYTQNNPEYAINTETLPLAPFDRIITADDTYVKIVESDTYRAVIEGRNVAIDEITFVVEDGLLTVRRDVSDIDCIFCGISPASVTIYAPAVSLVEVKGGRATFTDYNTDILTLSIDNGSIYGDLEVENLTIMSNNSRLNGNIKTQILTLEAKDSSFELNGNAEAINLSLINTQVYADSLIVKDATVDLINSYAHLTVRGTLTQTTDQQSDLHVEGQIIDPAAPEVE